MDVHKWTQWLLGGSGIQMNFMSFFMLSCAIQIISNKFHSKYHFTMIKKQQQTVFIKDDLLLLFIGEEDTEEEKGGQICGNRRKLNFCWWAGNRVDRYQVTEIYVVLQNYQCYFNRKERKKKKERKETVLVMGSWVTPG